jgi:rhomboid family GlyGly-CTERM serine protease
VSRAEAFTLAGVLVLLLVQAAATHWPELGAALEYRRAVVSAEPWRLLTGHWVHINWPHVLINAGAWFVLARLFPYELTPWRQAVIVLSASVAIGAGLALGWPDVAWYRGFSGILHALFFAGATTWLLWDWLRRARQAAARLWLPVVLLVGGGLKVAFEQPATGVMPYAPWLGAAVVPQAHLLGALCGMLVGAILALSRHFVAPPLVRKESE